jgi:hypothetical protein
VHGFCNRLKRSIVVESAGGGEHLNMARETSQFMGEAHVHGFCNRLKRSIVVVDVREPAVVLSKYQPGSDMQRQLSMLEALQLRNQPTTASSPFMMRSNHEWSPASAAAAAVATAVAAAVAAEATTAPNGATETAHHEDRKEQAAKDGM